MVKISNNLPPIHIYERAVKQFGIDFYNGIVFAYDNTIHSIVEPEEDIVVHEMTHFEQQERMGGADKWWDKYFDDPKFRLEQEIEAYQNQYKFLFKIVSNRDNLANYLWRMANNLSGQIYGNMISHREAMKLIRNGLKK